MAEWEGDDVLETVVVVVMVVVWVPLLDGVREGVVEEDCDKVRVRVVDLVRVGELLWLDLGDEDMVRVRVKVGDKVLVSVAYSEMDGNIVEVGRIEPGWVCEEDRMAVLVIENDPEEDFVGLAFVGVGLKFEEGDEDFVDVMDEVGLGAEVVV